MITSGKEKNKAIFFEWRKKLLLPLILQIVAVIIFIAIVLLFSAILFFY